MADVQWPPEAIAHMRDRHGVSTEQAEEAIDEPESLLLAPDPASRSGRSDRIVGWSSARGELLVVIVVRYQGQLYGANAWPANDAHRKLYEERRDDG